MSVGQGDGAVPGAAPGSNASPLGASFRDLPVVVPQRLGWVVPAATVGGALLVLLVLIVLGAAR